MEILRLPCPTLEQFQRAAEVRHPRWSYLGDLDTPARLEGLQKLGVELVVAQENGRMQGVCFVLPAKREAGGVGRVAGFPRTGPAAWRALRRRGVKLGELLLVSPEAKKRALWVGYLLLRMPAWCWDRTGGLEQWLSSLARQELSFLDTDKIL